MSAMSIIRVPMAKREKAECLLEKMADHPTHVDENGLGGTVDIYIKASTKEANEIAKPLGFSAEAVE
ncbi:MAG: hypothetical protein GF334_01030 [Candidatus Altiarchaeales archaeon]|nr:hypothetical protein [Candidatus Altiarchaeales archaeon]